jgi:hypothetical protein
MSVLSGNSFVFPRISMFASTSYRETLRLSGKQNKLFPSRADIKYFYVGQFPSTSDNILSAPLPKIKIILADTPMNLVLCFLPFCCSFVL